MIKIVVVFVLLCWAAYKLVHYLPNTIVPRQTIEKFDSYLNNIRNGIFMMCVVMLTVGGVMLLYGLFH